MFRKVPPHSQPNVKLMTGDNGVFALVEKYRKRGEIASQWSTKLFLCDQLL